MTITTRDIWVSFLAYLKSKTSVTSLLNSSNEIKERQWQGEDFIYPAIRISVEMYPDVTRCKPDRAKIFIDCYSEEKSSDESQTIAAAVHVLLHGIPFTSVGLRFPIVLVTKVNRPERTIYAWDTKIEVDCQVNPV